MFIRCLQLPELVSLLRGYLDNLHSAKQELSIAFTNEAFSHLVQVRIYTVIECGKLKQKVVEMVSDFVFVFFIFQKCVIESKSRSIYSFIEAGNDVRLLFSSLTHSVLPPSLPSSPPPFLPLSSHSLPLNDSMCHDSSKLYLVLTT